MMEQALPESWILGTIDQVCTHPQYGWTCKAQPHGDLKLLRTTDITSGDIDWCTVPFCSETPKKEEDYYLQDGDIVVSRAGSVGKSFIIKGAPPKAVFASYLVRFKPNIEKYYVYYFMQSRFYWSQIEEKSAGIAIPNVNGSKLAKISLPIAPLNEQKRIVDRIEQLFSDLDAGEALLKKVQKQLATYRQSVLKAAVTGELTKDWRKKNRKNLEAGVSLLSRINKECKSRIKNWKAVKGEQEDASLFPQVPDEWAIERLGNLNLNVFDGPFGSNLKTSDYTSSGVRVIRLENIGRGYLVDEKQSFISKKKYETIKKHTVVPNDIIFSSFVTDAIRSTLVPEHIPFAVNKADCFCIRFFGETLNSKFVQYFLQSQNAFRQVEGMIHGVGRPRINTTQLKDVMIPICCLKEQEEIVSCIEDAFSQITALEAWCAAELKRSATLRQSILKSAFSGKLVSQDPADEPACELLKRIQQDNSGNKANKKAAAPKEKGRRGRKAKARAA